MWAIREARNMKWLTIFSVVGLLLAGAFVLMYGAIMGMLFWILFKILILGM